jgi:hypothetical protein
MEWVDAPLRRWPFEKDLRAGQTVIARIRNELGAKGEPLRARVTINLPGVPQLKPVMLDELPRIVAVVENRIKAWREEFNASFTQ